MILLLFVFAVAFYKDFLTMIKEKDKKAIFAFAVIFCIGVGYSIFLILGVKIESVMVLMHEFLKKVGISYPA